MVERSDSNFRSVKALLAPILATSALVLASCGPREVNPEIIAKNFGDKALEAVELSRNALLDSCEASSIAGSNPLARDRIKSFIKFLQNDLEKNGVPASEAACVQATCGSFDGFDRYVEYWIDASCLEVARRTPSSLNSIVAK